MDDRADLDAPPDVDATIDWLLGEGFELVELRALGQANGNKVVELVRGPEHVIIQRDRGVWELGMRGDGWVGGLHTLYEAATGVVFEQPRGGPLPNRSPSDDLQWVDAVPAIFAWRDATPDWRTRHDRTLEAGAERIRRRRG